MSKSLGNGIDPIEVIEKYGADTLRFSMIIGATPGNDIRFHWDKVENTRNFANKIWNASRFVLMNLADFEPLDLDEADLSVADRWILTRLQQRIAEVTGQMERYDLGEAARTLYEFIWDEFCDWYIEIAKISLFQKEDVLRRRTVQNVLHYVLTNILKLIHPFMPFITEEIYQYMPQHGKTIMLESWPLPRDNYIFNEAAEHMQVVMNIIRAIRNIRAEFNVNPGQKIKAIIQVNNQKQLNVLQETRVYIKNLTNIEDLLLTGEDFEKPRHAASALTSEAQIFVPLEGIIDVEKELARLNKELQKAEADLNQALNKLNNEKFISRAPAEVIEKEKNKATEARNKREGLLQRIAILKM